MFHQLNARKAILCGALFSALFAAAPALASDPLPGDLVAPPPNVNIGMFYNEYSNADTYGAVRGHNTSYNTHLAEDIVVARYIRTFSLAGYTAGVQVYLPYVAFTGSQRVGTATPFGRGQANLASHSGFDQPNFSAFYYPINNETTGTYAVISPWISPPVSSFNKNYSLNAGTQNVWTYEMEVGFRTILFGTPAAQNLSIELWNTSYLYGQNHDSAVVSPAVSADTIPFPYSLFVHNPLQPASATPAVYRQQPSTEFRIYLPYQFYPATRAFIAPGFYQSLGGKATYKINGFGVVDSGTRTEESQLRLIAGSFVSPRLLILAIGDYDVAAHGGPLNRTFIIRAALFF